MCFKDEEATWCPCQKAYCTLHIKEHEESCWYHEHDKDAGKQPSIFLKTYLKLTRENRVQSLYTIDSGWQACTKL